MMANGEGGILRESRENADISDESGVDENSAFSNSARPSPELDANGTSIIQDIKFRTVDVNEMATERVRKRKMVEDARREVRKKVEEEYNRQKQERVYKRLMHLLTKSKFYSAHIMSKLNADVSKKKGGGRPPKKMPIESDENAEPSDQSPHKRRPNKRIKVKDYMSPEMKKKLRDQNGRMNLSQEEIQAELHSQLDDDNNDKGGESDKATFVNPKYFRGTLREYQIEGLQWLLSLYKNGVNGILADEMGLGKTIQVIALFSELLEKRLDGPYLIVAPLSTIPNWQDEFKTFAPTLPVVLLHGKPEVRAAALRQLNRKHPIDEGYSTYPIVLTTYEVPLNEKNNLYRIKWRYIVIDEGHRIKNYNCALVKVLKACDSMNRLLLTGTPLQNNLSELWSMLNFLLPEIFDDLAVFESWFDAKELQQDDGAVKVLKQEEEKNVLSTLREILKPFILRRLKEEVCLEIPGKKEIIVYAPMTELQYDLYRAVLNYDLDTLSKIEEQSKVPVDYVPLNIKRRCAMRNKYSSSYVDLYSSSREASHSPPLRDRSESESQQAERAVASNISYDGHPEEPNLDVWRRYANIDERNRDFFIRIRFGNRGALYKQIVNHPFLLHCPLDHSGLPEISENLVKSCGKLLVLDAMLKKLHARGHKVLLFSTMTMILDLLADYLGMRPWRFLMLDGRRGLQNRQENIKLFNTDPDVFMFLISTRAGGVGLNLAGADTVIIYDSDWNPQCDLQAMARCHRIGQTRPVAIYRICTKGTIDERIIGRAAAKRKLEKMVISKNVNLNADTLSNLRELKCLLDSSESKVVTAEKEVYTDEELDKILDRSDLFVPTAANGIKAD